MLWQISHLCFRSEPNKILDFSKRIETNSKRADLNRKIKEKMEKLNSTGINLKS